MHGDKVVAYTVSHSSLNRRLLDDTLREGHGIVAGDFLDINRAQVVAGWRAENANGNVGRSRGREAVGRPNRAITGKIKDRSAGFTHRFLSACQRCQRIFFNEQAHSAGPGLAEALRKGGRLAR